MMNSAPSLQQRAQAELELRQRQRAKQRELRALTLPDFAARTQIEVPNDTGTEVAHVPFAVWPSQRGVLDTMTAERLVVFLKARQIGVSWLACLFAMRACSLYPGYPVLCLSRSQDDADKLIHRTSFLYHQHQDKAWLSPLIKDNTGDLAWANGSSVVSLAATKNAGRGFTGALAILDEWAFMAWPRQTLAAVKPTIDAGGKLFIISSADGQGSAYHQFWQHAESGLNGYKAIFLPWFAHPERGDGWRTQKIVEASGDTASVLREYPANAIEAFTAAAGLVYDVWSDGPEDGNVTDDAEYDPNGGPVILAIDDGYAGALDAQTGRFTSDSHPRAVLLCQLRDDGRICVFAEDYRVKTLSDQHIESVLNMGYPDPDYAVIDSAAAELRGRLQSIGIGSYGKPQSVEESIKECRRMIAPDANGWRRILVHPRCSHLRFEMASYRYDDKGSPIAQHDHGVSALRYLAYRMRYE
jgi:terminase large subunit-like protein